MRRFCEREGTKSENSRVSLYFFPIVHRLYHHLLGITRVLLLLLFLSCFPNRGKQLNCNTETIWHVLDTWGSDSITYLRHKWKIHYKFKENNLGSTGKIQSNIDFCYLIPSLLYVFGFFILNSNLSIY